MTGSEGWIHGCQIHLCKTNPYKQDISALWVIAKEDFVVKNSRGCMILKITPFGIQYMRPLVAGTFSSRVSLMLAYIDSQLGSKSNNVQYMLFW